MRSLRTRQLPMIGILAVLLLTLVGFHAPADAATARAVSLAASPSLAYGGGTITFTGKVTKSPKGSTVKIQRKSGSTWVAAGATTTTTSAGAYSVQLALPSTPADYSYRALAPKTTQLAGVYSKTVTVTALRHTSATIAASPASIVAGGSSTLTGTVSPFVSGSTVTIQRLSGNAWVTDSSTTVSASGTFSKSVHPSTTTTYRAAVSHVGLNAGTQSAGTTVTVTSANAPVVTTTSLPQGDKGVAYPSTTLTHTRGAGTWTITVGALPAGINLAAATGVLSGTPTAGGTATFTVTFTETSSSLSGSKALSIVVTPPPSITTTTLPDATRGVAYTTTLAHTGSAGTWTLATQDGFNGLPTGLTFDGATGTISGTVTGASGTYGIYPTFTETSTGRTAFKPLSLVVTGQNVAITTTSVPDGTTGTPYSQQLAKTGGAGTWTLKSGTTPPGITLSDTGLLAGTPTAVGDYGFAVTFTETSTGTSDNQAYLLHVSAPGAPVISPGTLPDGVVGTAYSAQLSATGTGTWSLVYDVPPPGIELDNATGALTGTPTTAGDYLFIVKFTTATSSNTKAYVIHVDPAPGG